MKNQKGITLIALVITIIVLIILAGVAINLTLGDNGILRRAQDTQKLSDEQTVKEKIEIAVLDVQIEEVEQTGRLTHKKLSEVLESKDSNITLNPYTEGDTILTGTYLYEGQEYGFTIDENFKVIIGEVEEAVPQPVTFGEITWESGKASITLSTTSEGTIEYQVNGTDGTWIEGSQVTGLQLGDKVYVRVNDGNTVTEPQEIEIKDEIAPEEFEITVPEDSITYEALKVSSTGTVDNQTGIKNYSYVAASNGTIVKEIKDQTVTEYLIEGLSPETEYVVYMLAYDNAGNVRKSNEVTVTTSAMPVAKMFGQYVDYPVDIDDNPDDYDWQIFYKEDDPLSPNYGATYIIPDYYVLASKMQTSIANAGMTLYQENVYGVGWKGSTVSYKEITDTVKEKFMYDYQNTGNLNINYVSRLLEVSAWEEDFITTDLKLKGGMAIGGPTIKMWCASWNKAYPTQQITVTNGSDGDGYEVSPVSASSYAGYKNAPNVYFVTKSKIDGSSSVYYKVDGYMISSPGDFRDDCMFTVERDGGIRYAGITQNWVNGFGYFSDPGGIRPLVYLPPSVKLTPDAETANLWNINY